MGNHEVKGARNRNVVKADYSTALGLAMFCFASCEWQIVWCCEKIRPGSLTKITGEEMTAGQIAKYFIDVARNMPRSAHREELKAAAHTFMRLVPIRNAIAHGKPCTGPQGETRLSSDGILEIDDLERAADQFAECGSELNRMYYQFLAE